MQINNIHIRPLEDKDIDLMVSWLNKEYILKWYLSVDDWLTEIKGRNDEFSWLHHFIVMDGETPIGFCQYYDCFYANDMEDWFNVTQYNDTFSIDYLIGNEDYLGKGYGKEIIRVLSDTIRKVERPRCIIVQPDADNMPSNGVLLANSYVFDEKNGYYIKLL